MPELALFVALDTVNRFTMRAAAGLLLFGVRHVVCRHSTTGLKKESKKKLKRKVKGRGVVAKN